MIRHDIRRGWQLYLDTVDGEKLMIDPLTLLDFPEIAPGGAASIRVEGRAGPTVQPPPARLSPRQLEQRARDDDAPADGDDDKHRADSTQVAGVAALAPDGLARVRAAEMFRCKRLFDEFFMGQLREAHV